MNIKSGEHSDTQAEKVFNVFALRRAGQHAIVNWAIESLHLKGVDAGHANNILEYAHGPHQNPRRSTANEAIARAGGRSVIVANYEDALYSERSRSPAYTEFVRNPGTETHDLVIIRDYYNLLASRLAKRRDIENDGRDAEGWRNVEDLEEAWLDHAQAAKSGAPLTLVNYNRWVGEVGYRSALAKLLEVESAEHSLSHVPNFGGGSSFEGRSLNGKASAMKVLERWKSLPLEICDEYRAIVEGMGRQTVELNKQIFNISKQDVLGNLALNNY